MIYRSLNSNIKHRRNSSGSHGGDKESYSVEEHSLFYPDDGSSTFLWDFGKYLPD